MTQFEKLDLLLRECILEYLHFNIFPAAKQIANRSHGVYVSPDTWTDAMFLLHLRCDPYFM